MPIGFDCGTYNLVCCRRNADGKFEHQREVNAFIEMPLENRFVFNMMKNAGVPLIERKEANLAYALGEAAVDLAYTMPNIELKRPMKDGCLNPKEKHAQQIMSIMMHGLIGDKVNSDEVLYYSIPSNAINEETDAKYHSAILESIFKAYEDESGHKVKAYPINEALALIYAELQQKAWTGIGVSCLIPGTKIYTNNGIVNIETVKIGDEVITHKGRWRKISNVITKNFEGTSTKIQIQGYSNSTKDYQFVDNHELYVFRDNNWKWIGCEEIEEGDIVGEPIVQQNRNNKVLSMTLCERTTCSKQWIKHRIEITSDVQRLIGYFLGDGSINDAEGCIQFDFKNTEIDNINDVKEILHKNFSKLSSETKKDENCTRIKCYSRGLVNYFKNNFYDESKIKKYPWNIENLSKNHCLNLLAGLVRSDGSISDNSICFGNTNTRLILLAKQMFSKLGIPTSISYREPRSHVYGDRIICGKKDEWTISTGSKFGLFSIKDLIEHIDCNNSNSAEKVFIQDGFCCGKVQKVEHDEYVGVVYDLQVEEDHSFSGPFLTIHNCGAGMINLCFAMFGTPVFEFSIVNSGDWIDKMAAKATGESSTFINREKMKVALDEEQDSLVHRAIAIQYQLMIQTTVTEIKKGLEKAGDKKTRRKDKDGNDIPIDIVIAGGTSSPKGFDKLFAQAVKEANLPVQIGEIIRPKDPLYSVAQGCLVAAENAV